ncbi:unnamed protein product [Microthlaspi erraticum]|uniref:Uncharacterized protein n=1 Tax=Microthlaspi erraticum TaxID=1685480 RepID=A0A6D2KXY8_9BRAS|nr:unnamed protein product [Microthlaspi erraticum]
MNSQKRERTKLKGEYKEMPTWSLIELELVFTSTGIARMAVNWLTRESLGGLEVFLLGLSGPGLQSWIKVMGPYGLDSRRLEEEFRILDKDTDASWRKTIAARKVATWSQVGQKRTWHASESAAMKEKWLSRSSHVYTPQLHLRDLWGSRVYPNQTATVAISYSD